MPKGKHFRRKKPTTKIIKRPQTSKHKALRREPKPFDKQEWNTRLKRIDNLIEQNKQWLLEAEKKIDVNKARPIIKKHKEDILAIVSLSPAQLSRLSKAIKRDLVELDRRVRDVLMDANLFYSHSLKKIFKTEDMKEFN